MKNNYHFFNIKVNYEFVVLILKMIKIDGNIIFSKMFTVQKPQVLIVTKLTHLNSVILLNTLIL